MFVRQKQSATGEVPSLGGSSMQPLYRFSVHIESAIQMHTSMLQVPGMPGVPSVQHIEPKAVSGRGSPRRLLNCPTV